MKPIATFLTIVICLVILTAATLDIHCGALRPADDTFILVCRAGRLSQFASLK